MPTTIQATALPHSLADDAPFQLTVFITHKLVDGPQNAVLADFPAATDWVSTLAACTLTLTTSLNPNATLPLRIVSNPDSGSWTAVLASTLPVSPFPTPTVTSAIWNSNPANRMSDHAVDLHIAAITAAPIGRPSVAADPVSSGLLETLANLDPNGPLRRLLDDAPRRTRRAVQVPGQRLRETLTTIGPLTEVDETDPEGGHGWELPELPPYQSTIVDEPSPVQVLLDDPDADLRLTRRLDALVGDDLAADPQLQMIVDSHAMRRYYERPEQPQQEPRPEPDPDAPPTPRPGRPEHDFHARIAQFGSTPALLRRLGIAVDVVLDGLDPQATRAALAGATWVSVTVTSPNPDLVVILPRRTLVDVEGNVFAARSSREWVGGALPLSDDEWVVLDVDPDASGLKLDQHARNLGRRYASEANGDSATSVPATLRATGFAIARRNRASQLRGRVEAAELLASDNGARDLLFDDLVRGIRIEVWDDVTKEWHSLHQRRVTVTGDGNPRVLVLDDEPDVGFLQLSALNRALGDPKDRLYLHEVVAGWDGWSLAAPRPGLTIIHVEPPGQDGATEAVVEIGPDLPIDGARTIARVEPSSLPRLRYGMSYSFRVLGVDLAGNSVPSIPRPLRVEPDGPAINAARTFLERLRNRYQARDLASIATGRRAAMLEHLSPAYRVVSKLPVGLLSGDALIDATLETLIATASIDADEAPAAARTFDGVVAASRVLAAARENLRVRPQLTVNPEVFAMLAGNNDLQLRDELRRPVRPVVTTPRPYLRWDPIPPPALVAKEELGTGEQSAHLVVRTGIAAGPNSHSSIERHIAPPKATQLEAETAGRFDNAIGTGDAAEIRRLYAIALAERGTLLDQFIPSLTDPLATVEQSGIALVDRPGADVGSVHRATLADISADRGRPIGEGQYVVHNTNQLRLPYLPDPYATGVSLVFYEAGAPHGLPEPRALQAINVPYLGTWPKLQPLRIILEPGDQLDANVLGHEVRVKLPPGEQIRVAISSSLEATSLEHFGLWRSHLASVVDPSDGYTTDEVVASAALMRAACSGWTWWLTPSIDVRLVHAVPAPVRAPEFKTLSLFLRPPGRSVAAFSGLVDVHGSSTDMILVRASWTEQIDDVTATGPQTVTKSDVVVRSPVGQREKTGVLFLYDFQPTGTIAKALGGIGLHRMLQTFEDTHYRHVTYVPMGTTRYAEFFEPSQVSDDLITGEPVVLDIPSSARPAAPLVLDAVPLLRWEEQPEPDDPFAWRQVRESGVRIWLARPWFSSGDDELLGVLVFDTDEWVPTGNTASPWKRQPKAQSAPDGATSLWGADPIVQHGASTSNPTVPPLLEFGHLVLDLFESGAAESVGIRPPIHGEVVGGRNRGWPDGFGNPVAVAGSITLRDVRDHPTVRVLGYRPQFDESSGRWFVDIALHETPALWPFVRLAVARYQPHSIAGSELSPVALTSWVQPLPSRILTVSRPNRTQVQVSLTGVVNWLRWDPRSTNGLSGEQLSADSPTGDAAVRAVRLQQSRTVQATVQTRPVGAGNLEWEMVSSSMLLAVSVDESSTFQATWSGSVSLPVNAGTSTGDAVGYPSLRRPGDGASSWRVLVEEHELLDADPVVPDLAAAPTKRLVYAGIVGL